MLVSEHRLKWKTLRQHNIMPIAWFHRHMYVHHSYHQIAPLPFQFYFQRTQPLLHVAFKQWLCCCFLSHYMVLFVESARICDSISALHDIETFICPRPLQTFLYKRAHQRWSGHQLILWSSRNQVKKKENEGKWNIFYTSYFYQNWVRANSEVT